jgi:hypothetical protein
LALPYVVQQHQVWFDITDVSDVSYQCDEIAAYYFHDSKDAVMFTLKYKSS